MSSAVSVPYVPASAAAVRKRMRQELGRRALPADLIDDATLVLTELITNSLCHARPVDGGSVRTAWRFFGGQLEISVTDGGSSSVPHITPAPPDALGGRGMTIVNALAPEWGVRNERGEMTVWARLPLGKPGLHADMQTGFAGGERVKFESAGDADLADEFAGQVSWQLRHGELAG